MRRQSSIFERFLDSVERTGDITLRYYFQKGMMMNDIFDRQYREKLKEEIIQELIPRVKVVLDEQAIKQIDEMLKNLGK